MTLDHNIIRTPAARYTTVTIAALTAITVSGAATAATASAAPASNGTQVTLVLVNNSPILLQLHDSSTSGGAHITGRLPVYLRPGATATQTVTNAADQQFIQINYVADNPQQTHAGFGVHVSGSRIDSTAGTGVSDAGIAIRVLQSPTAPTTIEYDVS